MIVLVCNAVKHGMHEHCAHVRMCVCMSLLDSLNWKPCQWEVAVVVMATCWRAVWPLGGPANQESSRSARYSTLCISRVGLGRPMLDQTMP